ncbi:hypothetical protein Q3G72_027444 [Acer saccharum]|nr:hypothetical protein Q3G72_027444 [Acer saccharum]
MRQLQVLNLDGNRLQGSIPSEICYLRNLGELRLSDNKFFGSIPACMGDITSLRVLQLNSNNLTSTIPSSLWNLIDILDLNLSNNSLIGELPLDIGNLRAVSYTDLAWNELSGEIPSSFGNLQTLINFSIAHNKLKGHIPESFGNLISLELLELSSNNLSGAIPKSLEKLRYLKYFNVSFNRLDGEIPTEGAFANFSAESFIGNDQLCGAPQLQVPLCKTGTIRKSKKTKLVILICIILAIASAIVVLLLTILWFRSKKKKGNSSDREDVSILATWRRIPYEELYRATNGFDENNLLGIGGFGMSMDQKELFLDKRPSLKNEKPYQEDPFTRDFGTSSFQGDLLVWLRRRKICLNKLIFMTLLVNLLKQKLVELEERIAKRQAEAAQSGSNSSIVADVKLSGAAMERHAPKMPDLDFSRYCCRGTLQPVDVPSQVSTGSSSRTIQESEKAMQDLVIQSNSTPQLSAASELIDHVDANRNSVVSTQHPVPSSVNMAPPSNQTVLHTVSAIPSQAERVLLLGPQSVPFVQPNRPAKLSTNQNVGVSQPIQPKQETSAHNMMKSDALSRSVDNQPGLVLGHMDLSQGNVLNEVASLPARESAETTVSVQEGRAETSQISFNNKTRSESGFLAEDQGQHNSVMRNFKSMSTRESEGLLNTGTAKEKYLTASKEEASVPANSVSELWKMLISSILQAWFLLSANHIRPDDKSNISGRNTGMSTRGGYRRVVSNKSWKHTNESESMGSDAINSWEMDSRSKDGKGLGKESFKKSQNSPHFEEGNHKRTIRSGEDVDYPLQSGIVHVFEQPGIEAPSDANASLR